MPKRARAVLAAFWAAGLLAGAVLLQRPSPLFVNLGAGDEPFAHGFRTRWEREGRRGNPDTMFRWTEDGARFRLPVAVTGSDVRVRMRLARFAPEPAQIVLLSAGREAARWTQESRGFHVREFTLGSPGAIDLQFRSESADGGPLGVALDWVEIIGAGGMRIPAGTALRALGLLLALPAVAGALAGVDAGLALGAVLAWCAAAGAALDRMGTLLALASACAPALVAAAVIATMLLRRRR
jgi:hypothetical protein